MKQLDSLQISDLSIDLQTFTDYYDLYGKPAVEECCKELMEKVRGIKKYMAEIKEYNLEYDVISLQNMCLDLSTTLALATDKKEKIGILKDMAAIRYKDAYNTAYLTKQGDQASAAAGGKYTTEQLKNYAEQEALEQKLICIIYDHADSEVKSKIDASFELLKVVSKCLSATIQQMSTFNAGSRYQS